MALAAVHGQHVRNARRRWDVKRVEDGNLKKRLAMKNTLRNHDFFWGFPIKHVFWACFGLKFGIGNVGCCILMAFPFELFPFHDYPVDAPQALLENLLGLPKQVEPQTGPQQTG